MAVPHFKRSRNVGAPVPRWEHNDHSYFYKVESSVDAVNSPSQARTVDRQKTKLNSPIRDVSKVADIHKLAQCDTNEDIATYHSKDVDSNSDIGTDNEVINSNPEIFCVRSEDNPLEISKDVHNSMVYKTTPINTMSEKEALVEKIKKVIRKKKPTATRTTADWMQLVKNYKRKYIQAKALVAVLKRENKALVNFLPDYVKIKSTHP